jgi:ribonuclease P protein component
VKRDLERTGGSAIGVDAGDAADTVADAGSRRFRPSDRLLDSRDFTRVLRRGRRRSSDELVVVTSEPGTAGRIRLREGAEAPVQSRLGITVGRKAGPSVQRNRFKRRVREWFRQHREELRRPLDIVVIARRPGIDLSLADLGDRLSQLLGADRTRPPARAEHPEKTQDS